MLFVFQRDLVDAGQGLDQLFHGLRLVRLDVFQRLVEADRRRVQGQGHGEARGWRSQDLAHRAVNEESERNG
ncbi:hypothetical protein [Luteibacter sp.]|uniref:hypothetical protein n=1 Tax=Luteibacter sp. TaxID=1886636 RepID=UPI002F3FFB8A